MELLETHNSDDHVAAARVLSKLVNEGQCIWFLDLVELMGNSSQILSRNPPLRCQLDDTAGDSLS